ncbi:MAG: hypothetical protein JSS20_20905 [Proteobacteria bacterium]|nr:hypothetical protein [Pseudomonadota bacterium]
MSNTPKFYAYAFSKRDADKRDFGIRIGAAWPTEKGDGLNLRLDALPLNFDGNITLTPPKRTEV